LRDQLTPHFRGAQAGVQTRRFETGVGLAPAIHDGPNVLPQVRQVVCRPFSAAGGIGIEAGQPTVQFVQALAQGAAIPAQLSLSLLRATAAEGFDGVRHKQSAGSPAQGLSGFDENGLQRLREFHLSPPVADGLEDSTHFRMVYNFQFP